MAAVAHGWKPTGKKAPPLSVAREFNAADKGSKLLKQGMRVGALKRRREKHG
jgi:hypothetical protein